MDDPSKEKKQRLQQEKKNKKIKSKRDKKPIIVALILTISMLMSAMALYSSMGESPHLEYADGIDGQTSLIITGVLYGTHACEEGGFSIQSGIDDDGDGELSGEEVDVIKNVCHGKQGFSGPMGNRGYWGSNGSNGSDGIDGLDGADGFQGSDGIGSLIDSSRGHIGPCPDGYVMRTGQDNDRDDILADEEVDSQLKLCFSELTNGRVTDLVPGNGHSFSSGCDTGIFLQDWFIFSGYDTDLCQLRIMKNYSEVSNLFVVEGEDYSPGKYLGFTEFEDRVWFDAYDGNSRQLWSTNGINTWQETNLSTEIDSSNSLIKNSDYMVLSSPVSLSTFGDSDSFNEGVFSNLSIANQVLAYNDQTGFIIDGTHFNGEIHSQVLWHQNVFWFIATTDLDGMELHSVENSILNKHSDNLSGVPGQSIPLKVIGQNLIFDSKIDSGSNPILVEFNLVTKVIKGVNEELSYPGDNTGAIEHNGRIWFDCNGVGTGIELCWYDGGNAQVHIDYIAGAGSSNPTHLSVIENELLVVIDDSGGVLMQVTDDDLIQVWDPELGNTDLGYYGEMWIGDDAICLIGDSATYGQELYVFSHGEITGDWIVIH